MYMCHSEEKLSVLLLHNTMIPAVMYTLELLSYVYSKIKKAISNCRIGNESLEFYLRLTEKIEMKHMEKAAQCSVPTSQTEGKGSEIKYMSLKRSVCRH